MSPGRRLEANANAQSRPAPMVWNNVEAMSTGLRGKRSAITPPTGDNRPLGTNPAAAMMPDHTAFPVASATNAPNAIVSIHVPMLETKLPVQYSV
jgi:hypothetical protein